jgi:gamma-glutamylcyclotransferase (GGCT)/AIG2-like uncharacterized protein YtfP
MIYFAYGSNMFERELKGYCPGALFLSKARLNDYRLDFTRFSETRQCGVGDVVKAKGFVVWGVLCDAPENEMPELDEKEGASRAYERKRVQVVLPDGAIREAMTYMVREKLGTVLPSREYLKLYLKGAQEHDLPDDYMEMLKCIRTKD